MRVAMRERRKELRYSQQNIADITGIERTRYGKIENGKLQKVDIAEAYKIACALETTMEALFLSDNVGEGHATKAS